MKKLFTKHTLVILLCYLTVIITLQLVNGWYQNFSDAVHYLWIADQYAEGDWTNAINTYWGPMISWLLVILKPLIHEPFVRFRILQIILGFTALVLVNRILRKKEIDNKNSLIFTLLLVPLIASFAWFYLTPDLLLSNGILLLILFYSSDHQQNLKTVLLAALLGAILFHIKSAGLYFFIFIVTGKFVLEKKQWNLRSLLHNCLIAFFVLLFCTPWICLVSKKHGSFTMGTSSEHNYKINAPRITPGIYGEVGSPYHLGTLTEPVPADAFDAFVEQTHQSYLSWEGMDPKEIRSYYFKIIIKNLESARSMFFGVDIGSIFVLMFISAFIVYRKGTRQYVTDNNSLFLVLTGNILLYLPFFFMDRYTWPGLLSLYIAAVILMFRFPLFKNKLLVSCIAFLFLGLNLFTAYKEYIYTLPEKPIIEAIWNSKQQIEMKRTVWICNKEDKRLGPVKGMIYYNKGQYLGALFYDVIKPEEIRHQLDSFNINTLITLDERADSVIRLLNSSTANYTSPGLRLYQYNIVPKP